MIDKKTQEEIIEKLTRMLIKQDLKDKKKGVKTYIRKTTMYKRMIKLFKEYL